MSTLSVDTIQGKSTAGTVNISGHVIQVVNVTTSTLVQVDTTSATATGLSLAITPSSTSNKILVMGSVNGVHTSAVNSSVNVDVFRGASSSDTKISDAQVHAAYDTSSTDNQRNVPFCILDSPSTTSAQTYSVFFNRNAGSGNVATQANSSQSSLTLMEISG
tara:strand:+ start:483 stop:968 length:486 start_codon:yes stop_codon:yes gene_type:complete